MLGEDAKKHERVWVEETEGTYVLYERVEAGFGMPPRYQERGQRCNLNAIPDDGLVITSKEERIIAKDLKGRK